MFYQPIYLSPKHNIEFVIDLDLGTLPIYIEPYRKASAELKELNSQLQDLFGKGFIRLSVSLWGVPVLSVKKKDGSMCICIDYK